jgi:hypothetical protein
LNDSKCVTIPTTPVCITSSATCGCVKDTDCKADFYCDTTTAPTGVCTAGCEEGDGGTNNCSTGKYCLLSDGGAVGTCTSEPCNSNADCKTPALPVCDTIDQPHVCVQCLNDPDCPAATGDICDPTYHCVECDSAQTKNCNPAGKGAACLASETCGCATDADCGDATSGRVCDPTSHTCTAGCRASGGNGCPSPETCSSTDGGTIGQCQGQGTAASSSSSSGGTGGAGGATGTGGTGGAAHVVTQSVGCGCRIPGKDGGEDEGRTGALAALLAAVLLGLRSSRRSAQNG